MRAIIKGVLLALLMTSDVAAFPNKFYNVVPGQVDTENVSTDVTVKNTALGSCICDVTAHSCDAYCCCDPDCDAGVLKLWNANYDRYCAKNFIGSTFKPMERCIDKKHVFKYNTRMGMSVSETESKLCVELDSRSVLSTYKEYIPSFEGTPQNLQFDIKS